MSARALIGAIRRVPGRLGVALALAAGVVLPAAAGGPLEVHNHQPVVYPGGGATLALNLDRGNLGTRTNAQAVAMIQNAVAMWNGVGTSTMRLAIGTQLAVDYTAANYTGVLGKFTDGLNPVIFDTDGTIIEAMFGAGTRNYIIGFAGSAYTTTGPAAGTYLEGQAVLNGFLNVSTATLTVVFAHEFGHFLGLDHSQLDGTQGLAESNHVLMYPIAYRTLQSLHEDDAATVTSIYPAAGAASVYGQLTGTFTTAGGAAIRGANLWARETSTGKVYSIVSDFLKQGSGHFRLYLPAGTYNLYAESIGASFYGGSSVGPYANTSTDVSFQSPHPITPVALGAGSPVPILIVPGCVATATFRVNGTGSVSGDCVPASLLDQSIGVIASVPATLTYASGATFTVSATGGGSGNPVTFGSQTAGVCTTGGANGATVAMLAAGTCTIAASQAGNASYNPAPQVTQNFSIGKAAQAIGALTSTPPTLTYSSGGTFTVSATGGASGNPVTFTAQTAPVCTTGGINGATVTMLTAGTCTIAANQAGNANYSPAPQVTRAFAVGEAVSTTTLATSNASVPAGTSVTLTATVTGAAPTGTVGFKLGAMIINGCGAVALTGSGNTRTAQCTTPALAAGGYLFLATYFGDPGNAPSSGSVGQTVTVVPGLACSGYTDTDSASVFCPSIDWVTNRDAVPSCNGSDPLYCPTRDVTREQMAAYLYGLGNAMTPIPVVRQAAIGAVVLDAEPVVCQTADTLVADFPRRAELDAVFMGKSTADVGFAVEPVASFDNGASWWPLVVNAGHGLVEANHWGNLRVAGYQDVEVGQTVRFGLQVSRDGQPGSANLTDSRCNLRALLQNRNGTFSPF